MPDPILQLKHRYIEDHHYVDLTYKDGSTLEAEADFEFEVTAQDKEDIRWYLEDYLQYPLDPKPEIARRIEDRMRELGTLLFDRIFRQDDDTRDIWTEVRNNLSNTRIEVLTGVTESATIPWELLRDSGMDKCLALGAKSFVRGVFKSAVKPLLTKQKAGPIRILLVICRPGENDDVPFRSVASRLIKGLDDTSRAAYSLDVLRPATYESLTEQLREAKAAGQPYHVVHFDGHGDYFNLADVVGAAQTAHQGTANSQRYAGSAYYPHEPRAHERGYLLFENPETKENIRFVDGTELGQLLRETEVSVLVLNACRSAKTEALEKPEAHAETHPRNVHEQARAYGSLALEIMDTGVAGVVAMRHSVYVVTAAQFVADLYSALAQGQSLGEAVTYGRKQLADDPLRTIAYDPIPLQDWCVPVVFEAAAIKLFPRKKKGAVPTLTLSSDNDENLADLPRPDAGFFGRDETLLALDRAFDTQHIVLLHAYAGSGKTMTAAEFARWYVQTHGLEGPVLFTSFEHHKPLARVLDDFGQVFDSLLQQNGIHWSALTDEQQRKDLVLNVLSQIPVLWIWDNVEPINGFPKGTPSLWSDPEQKELAYFLKATSTTKAKFLLTSRRDEHDWLVELPKRIAVPPMPMQERVQLTRALAAKRDHKITDVIDWLPLLRYTQGNPMTITVVVGQALKLGIRTREEIEAFLQKLHAGEVDFEDDESQGRSKSLGASLNYGLENAFSEVERKVIALLHLFQGFVDVDALMYMGTSDEEWQLPEVLGLTREMGISLLDRAAEVGLLIAHGGGYYTIHPAVPWFFKREFYRAFSSGEFQPAMRAYINSMATLGNYYAAEYARGKHDVVVSLLLEESNLLYSLYLALRNSLWNSVIGVMQGLRQLYDHTGRHIEWRRLVEAIVPNFIDIKTDGPLAGLEEQWSLVTQYRVLLALSERNWSDALRLQTLSVDWDRKRAEPFLKIAPHELSSSQKNMIRSLAASLHDSGQIQRDMKQAECVNAYKESLDLSELIGEKQGMAICALNLGNSYLAVPSIRNLDEAEKWYRFSLELRDPKDRLGQAKCLGQLGSVERARFRDARKAGKPDEEILSFLNNARNFYLESVKRTPKDNITDLAVCHNELGNIYADADAIDKAQSHYDQSIRLKEQTGNIYGAAVTRYNVALVFEILRKFPDALLYAEAALKNYQSCRGAEADVLDAMQLIEAIKNQMNNGE